MIVTRKIAIICLVTGLVLAILLIINPFFSGTSGYDCSHQEDSRFFVINKDLNRSHTVDISVYNSSHTIQTRGRYDVVPGNVTALTLHPQAGSDGNYSVTFIEDGNISSHYEQLAISSDCTESFSLDPERGVLRPFDLWCAGSASNEQQTSVLPTRSQQKTN
ncbi:MAG: hypothetical protein WBL42_08785 [Methanoregula sp.]